MQIMETMLGRLGSRFTLHFLPRQKQVRLSPLGKYYDLPWYLTLGFKVGDTSRVLPFAGSEAPNFPEVEMEITMNSVTFRAKDRNLGLSATFTFLAPFYPKDEKLSTAPFFYLDVTLDSAPADKPVEFIGGLKLVEGAAQTQRGQFFEVSQRDAAGVITLDKASAQGGLLPATYNLIMNHWGPRQPPDSLSEKPYNASLAMAVYNWPESSLVTVGDSEVNFQTPASDTNSVKLQPGAKLNLLLATYFNEPVLEVKNVLHLFKYTQYFANLEAVIDYATNQEQEIREKSALFDSLLLNSSLGKSKADFIAFAFQSYLPSSWWTYPSPTSNPANSAQDEWFSLWEGCCTFHSTVDVEYNLAWIYLLLWPELLEKTISEWRGYFQKDERGEFMSHDIGGLLGANQQTYPHPMEVEENCNFILLTYALWRFTGRDEVRRDNLEAVRRLVRFILDSDTTGDGFPDQGTANTIDDASPAVQFGREQTYLAVKALSACWAASQLITGSGLRAANSDSQLEALNVELLQRVDLINKTLDSQAWLGDHFAVTLDRQTDGLIHPWTGEPLPPGELEGWDAYSIYTANGLLYLLATDTEKGANLPPGNYERYRRDLVEVIPQALIEYGCTHSSTDKSNIWVSQNLHRDFIGAYLGVDLSELTDRYWAFEQYENTQGRGGCFVDTYGSNRLHYYPRGITSLGLLYALAGLRLDKIAGRLQFKPVRVPLRVPLPTLADWNQKRIPWVEFSLENGKVVMELENEDLLNGLTVELL